MSRLRDTVARLGWIAYWLVVLGLLYAGLGLSIVRLLQSERGPAIRLESFTPLGFPLYAAVLVLLLIGALRRGTGHRTPMLLTALVAVVGLGLHGWWLAPSYVGDNPAPAPGAAPMVVMTSNLFEGQGDVDQLLAAVRSEGVDVLVLEEISMQALAAADAGGLADLLPYRIGGPNGYDPVSGTMVLATQPLGVPTPVATYHNSWLVDVGTGAAMFRVLAVHPVAPVTPEQWTVDHATILAAAEQAKPDLVLGDFNAVTDHEPMQALDRAGFHDAAMLANEGWQPTWPAHGLSPIGQLPVPPLVRIDHVLVASTYAVLGTHTVDIDGSDHLALVAEVARR